MAEEVGHRTIYIVSNPTLRAILAEKPSYTPGARIMGPGDANKARSLVAAFSRRGEAIEPIVLLKWKEWMDIWKSVQRSLLMFVCSRSMLILSTLCVYICLIAPDLVIFAIEILLRNRSRRWD
jgi:hypothetical protein